MFCCLNDKNRKKQGAYCRGMAMGSVLTVVSLVLAAISKKSICNSKKDMDKKVESTENVDLKKYEEDQKLELQNKVDEFNSRRLTIENESKNKNI